MCAAPAPAPAPTRPRPWQGLPRGPAGSPVGELVPVSGHRPWPGWPGLSSCGCQLWLRRVRSQGRDQAWGARAVGLKDRLGSPEPETPCPSAVHVSPGEAQWSSWGSPRWGFRVLWQVALCQGGALAGPRGLCTALGNPCTPTPSRGPRVLWQDEMGAQQLPYSGAVTQCRHAPTGQRLPWHPGQAQGCGPRERPARCSLLSRSCLGASAKLRDLGCRQRLGQSPRSTSPSCALGQEEARPGSSVLGGCWSFLLETGRFWMMLEGMGGQSLREMAPSGGHWWGRALGPHLCEMRSLGVATWRLRCWATLPRAWVAGSTWAPWGPTAVLWTRVVSWALLEG